MKQLSITFIDYWQNQPKFLVVVVGFILVLLIGVIDYFTTADISLAIFYLISITFATWFVGRRFGVLLALEATTVWWLYDLMTKSSRYFWVISWNAVINLGFFVITSYLLSNVKLAYEREKHLARTDSLTGALNQRHFLEHLQAEIDRSKRQQQPITVAYVDIDNFKAVNDRFGHSVGNRLLCSISQVARHQIRSIDVFARLGGDEFALLLPQTNYDQGKATLDRLYKQWLEAAQQGNFSVGFSIGAVTFIHPPDSVDAVIEAADRRMYSIKNGGKNGINHIQVETPSE